jgi:hypothetical protein
VIFLSYAREDAGLTAAPDVLFAALADELGAGAVFLDKQSIVAGARWQASIEDALGRARCLVVLFGERWAEVTVPRLTTPEEVLCRELETARTSGIPVLPVFIGSMPRRLDLPDALRSLDDLHWERLPVAPAAGDARSVAGRIIRVAVEDDLRQLVADRPDPLVSGLALLRSMRPGVRRAVAAALADLNDRSPGESFALDVVDVARAAIDRTPLDLSDRWEVVRPLALSVGLDVVGSEPSRLRAVREALRPQLSGRGRGPGPLDQELLRVLDAILSRSLALRTGDGSRDPSGIVQARDALSARSGKARAMHQDARRFLVEDLIIGLDERVRRAFIDLRPVDRIRSRPGPGARKPRVRSKGQKRSR